MNGTQSCGYGLSSFIYLSVLVLFFVSLWRVFEKAVVAINAGPEPAAIPSLKLQLPDPPRGYIVPRKR